KQSHPLLKLRLASAMVSRARETGDVQQMVEAVERYEALAGEALRDSQSDRVLNRRVRLVIALEAMSFTGPFGIPRPSVEQIQRLYDEYQNVKESRLPLLSRISLARGKIFLTYALYLFRQQEGHPDAAKLRRE